MIQVMISTQRPGAPPERLESLVVVQIRNDGTSTPEIGNYVVRALDWRDAVLAEARLEGYDRMKGNEIHLTLRGISLLQAEILANRAATHTSSASAR